MPNNQSNVTISQTEYDQLKAQQAGAVPVITGPPPEVYKQVPSYVEWIWFALGTAIVIGLFVHELAVFTLPLLAFSILSAVHAAKDAKQYNQKIKTGSYIGLAFKILVIMLSIMGGLVALVIGYLIIWMAQGNKGI